MKMKTSYFSSTTAEFLNGTISLLQLSAVPLALMKGSRSGSEPAGLEPFSRLSRLMYDSTEPTWAGEGAEVWSGHAGVEVKSRSRVWL